MGDLPRSLTVGALRGSHVRNFLTESEKATCPINISTLHTHTHWEQDAEYVDVTGPFIT